MRNSFLRGFTLLSTIFLIFSAINAQDNTLASAAAGDKYVISAKAGGVNFVEGNVTVSRRSGRSGLLLKGDNLAIGDVVNTGANGKTEILLNPGSYVRLGENSKFAFKTTNLNNLQINLLAGRAIFEVFATDEFRVAVSSPRSRMLLVNTGVYDISVNSQGVAEIDVWNGKAIAEGNEVKKGRSALVDRSNVTVAKFEKDKEDPLIDWSRDRGKMLAKVISKLKRDDLRDPLMNSFLGRSWNMYNSFGVWVYDPFFGGYAFMPFGYGWSSPYGFGFGRYIGYYNLPYWCYQPTYPVSPNPGVAPTPPPVTTGQVKTPRTGNGPTPPFIRMQGQRGSSSSGRSLAQDSEPVRTRPDRSSPAPMISRPSPIIVKPADPTGARRP